MEPENIQFLTTIAQVSATLIGLSLLIPLFERFKRESASEGKELIPRNIRYTRFMEVLFLPVIIFLWPLTCSFLLIISYDLFRFLQGLFISQCFYLPYYFYKLQQSSKIFVIKPIKVFLDVTPCGLVLFSIVLSATSFLYEQNFYYGMLLLVIGGFLVFTRNLLVTYEYGLEFRLCEVDKKCLKKLEDFFKRIQKALDIRQEILKGLELACKKEKNDKELRRIQQSVAKQEADIQRLEKYKEDLQNRFKKIFGDNHDKRINLRSCIDFYERKKDFEEKHLSKFEHESSVIKRQLKRIYGIEVKREGSGGHRD